MKYGTISSVARVSASVVRPTHRRVIITKGIVKPPILSNMDSKTILKVTIVPLYFQKRPNRQSVFAITWKCTCTIEYHEYTSNDNTAPPANFSNHVELRPIRPVDHNPERSGFIKDRSLLCDAISESLVAEKQFLRLKSSDHHFTCQQCPGFLSSSLSKLQRFIQ